MKKKTLWIAIACAAVILFAAALIFGGGKKGEGTYDNLIVNGDFEALGANGLPEGWYADAYVMTVGYTDYDTGEGLSGRGARIVNHALNDARFAQVVSVSPNTLYHLHGYIKASAESGRGANLSIEGVAVFSDAQYDTDGSWAEVSLYGRTGDGQTSATVFARLGGYSGEAVGEAMFDNITLNRVDAVPEGYLETLWYAQQAVSVPTEADMTVRTANVWLILTSAAFVMILIGLIYLMKRPKLLGKDNKGLEMFLFAALTALALALRVILALSVYGYDIDVGDFIGWANAMAEKGPAEFYLGGGFSDYPPGYMLVLWLIGGIGKLCGGTTVFLVKLPAILCDLGIVYLLYSEGKKRVSPVTALCVAALYALSPLALTAGAAWGQADSVMTLLILLTVIYVLRGQWKFALPVYTLSVLVKPQALMFGPVGLLALVMAFIAAKKDKAALSTLLRDALTGAAAALLVALAVVIPFSVKQGGVSWLFELYGRTMTQYHYVTVNACNLYFSLGLNWVDAASSASIRTVLSALALFALPVAAYFFTQTQKKNVKITLACAFGALLILLMPLSFIRSFTDIGVMPYDVVGTGMIILSLALCGFLYVRGKLPKHLPLVGAVLLTLIFTSGTMMHERYLFPAAALLLIAYLVEKDKRILWLFLLVTLASFLNVGCVLDRNIRIGGAAGHLSAPMYGIDSDMGVLEQLSALLNLAASVLSVYTALHVCRENAAPMELPPPVKKDKAAAAPRDEAEDIEAKLAQTAADNKTYHRMSKRDILLMFALTALYAVLTFVNLGSTKAPQTYWVSTASDETLVFDLGETKTFEMLYYGGIHWTDYRFDIEISSDGENWSHPDSESPYPARMEDGDCFRWMYLTYANVFSDSVSYTNVPRPMTARYVRLSCQSIGLTLHEIVFRDPETDIALPVISVTDTRDQYDANALLDEQDTLDGEPSWFNGMYFDEIYHARTAYEHLNGLRTYETTHPPLGKVLMSFAVAVFGMTPFGWRFAGALTGVLMLPAMYLAARLLFRRRWLAPFSLLLMLFDTMHFTQTRIATIDSFVTLFILWAVYFMLRWLRMDFYGEKLWKTLLPLGLSGLFMGFAVASKWTGCYAGVGLALMFFYGVYRRYREHLSARRALSALPKPKKNQKRRDISARLMTAAETGGTRVLWQILSCLVFFVLVPLIIYYVSYTQYFAYQGGVTVRRVIEAAEGMLRYHSRAGLGMDHYFYSPWYEWPLDIKPMWYYSTPYSPEGYGSSITAMGNPIVWWSCLIGLIALIAVWAKRHITPRGVTLRATVDDSRPAMLLISFAAQYVPWVLVPRGTYIYHYFPSIPFIILAAALCLDLLPEKYEKAARITAIALAALSMIVFIAFFPYASGITVPTGWLDAMKWFNNWIWY